MYGTIIGDIAGSRYEFHATKEKGFELFPTGCEPTDDSVMTVAVAEVLLGLPEKLGSEADAAAVAETDTAAVAETDTKIREMFVESMRRWGKKYPHAGYGGHFAGWLTLPNPQPYNSYGNGSAMRVGPCGWLYEDLDTVRKMARLSAEVTHNHEEGIKGAESVAAAIFMARKGSSKEEIRQFIEKEFGYNLNRTSDEIRPDYTFDVTCQGSVPESIIAFLDGEDYEDTIRNAVSLGGDADTQAAIAGSIAEAFYGIPEGLIEQAKTFIPADLQEVVDRFYERVPGATKVAYSEPAAYFPEDIRKEFGLGEYAEQGEESDKKKA